MAHGFLVAVVLAHVFTDSRCCASLLLLSLLRSGKRLLSKLGQRSASGKS